MATVQTLGGPISSDQLGQTMMHEHIFLWNWDEEHKRAASIAYAATELNKLAAHGANTIVDVGPVPRRKMDWYLELAPQVPLNIILSTGFYLLDVFGWIPAAEFGDMTEDQMVARFMRELTEGIGDSGIRAGLVKAASNKPELTDWEKRLMRAAGRVQRQTGVPVCLHSCAGARNQFDELTRAGADPERLYFSHVEAEFGWEGRTLQEEARYLEAICKEGGSLFFNNYLFEFDTPHEDMMYLMHYLMDKGHLNRLLFGMDVNFNIDDDGRVWAEAEKTYPITGQRTWEAVYTGWIPLLKSWGFTDEHIRVMLVDNPRAMFSTVRI